MKREIPKPTPSALGPLSDAIDKFARDKRKQGAADQLFLVVSDKHEGGTSYIYGPFATAQQRFDFQVSHFPKGCGRLVHPISQRAFIKPDI